MMIFTTFLDWFWSSNIWLPPGTEWKDIVSNDKIKYPNPRDLLYYPIPLAIMLICVRYFVERHVLYPWGLSLGVKKQPKVASSLPPNPELEKVYKSKKAISKSDMTLLAKRTDLDIRQIERWLRLRKAKDKSTTIAKFSECGWRWIVYSSSFILGVYVLWNKPWLWNVNECWYGYPHQNIPDGIWCYYIFGSTFYWSLLITQAFDVKRKDFWQMFFHHILTLCLLAFSWFCNLTRIGALVLLLHDFADIFLESAKMIRYTRYTKLFNVLSVLFVISWIVTRLGIFSMYIIHSTLIEAPKIVPMFFAYYIFNGMLIALLCLHIFWTYFILLSVYRGLYSEKLEDARSSSESDTNGGDVDSIDNN